MSKKREQDFTTEEWQARHDAGSRAARRDYCDIFRFWTTCRYKPCRRNRKCSGHARACLKRGLDQIPYDVQRQANLRILAAIPADADQPFRTGRSSDPRSLVNYGRD